MADFGQHMFVKQRTRQHSYLARPVGLAPSILRSALLPPRHCIFTLTTTPPRLYCSLPVYSTVPEASSGRYRPAGRPYYR
jgi:hypothetical protein